MSIKLFKYKINCFIISAILLLPSWGATIYGAELNTDLLIVGGGASGVAAGVQAARMGTSTVIIEETPWVGGMLTAAGVSAIDGNHSLPAGMWGEFRDSLISHYGSAQALQTGWVSNVLFEPKVGEKIFRNIISNEPKLRLYTEHQLKTISKSNNGYWIARIINAKTGDFFTIHTKMVVDATELGDVAKIMGEKYDIGMEDRNLTQENIAPLQENGIIQDLTYVAVLRDYGRDVTMERPRGYDPKAYACCAVNDLCISPKEPDRMWSPEMMITYGKLPNNKYMINWPIEGNDYYTNIIEMTPAERTEALKKAKQFTLGFIYFLQTELGFNTLGLDNEEFPTDDNLPLIPYHRESRRIHGKVRFTLNHITEPYNQAQPLYRTTIAVGDYPVDHHHSRYTGSEDLPRLYFHPVPSFGLPLGTLVPANIEGLIVAEKSISVSNIVNGTTRLQPVVLQIGTAAGALASIATSLDINPAQVSVRQVQHAILDAGGYLLPYLDVDKTDERFKAYQRIGATGILRGVGRNEGWANQTWLRTDTLLLSTELDGLKELYDKCDYKFPSNEIALTVNDAVEIINNIATRHNIAIDKNSLNAMTQTLCEGKDQSTRHITRGEFAIIIDSILNPFDYKDVTLEGNFIEPQKQ